MKLAIAVVLPALAFALTGCASMSKDECLTADWRLIGFEDGASGRSPTDISERRKACASYGVTPDRAAYFEGYQEGVAAFCSYNRGLGDGTGGAAANRICPQDSDYQAGYADGLDTYCSYDRGLSAGKSGVVATGLCPAGSGYRTGYADGLDSFCTYDSGYSEAISGRSYARVCPPGMEAEFLRGFDFGSHVNALQTRLIDLEAQFGATEDEWSANEDRVEIIKGRVAYDDTLDGEQRAELLQEMEQLGARNARIAAELSAMEDEILALRRELHSLGVN